MSFVKRFSVFALFCALLLSAISCSGAYPELSDYGRALSETAPIRATVTSTLDTELGTLSAEYTATWSDGIEINYTKDKLSEITPGISKDELITEVSGSATVGRDGTLTGEISTLILNLLLCKINLDGEKLTYTEENGTLTFTVTKENTEAVLGTPLDYDVTGAIVKSESGGVKSITVTYTAASGEAKAVCEFE